MAALLELASEPFYIVASTKLQFGLRAGIDTTAMIAKCGLTLALIHLGGASWPPALVFAAGQLAFAGVVAAGYGAYGVVLMLQVRRAGRGWRVRRGGGVWACAGQGAWAHGASQHHMATGWGAESAGWVSS
jgi:hypothetical protein